MVLFFLAVWLYFCLVRRIPPPPSISSPLPLLPSLFPFTCKSSPLASLNIQPENASATCEKRCCFGLGSLGSPPFPLSHYCYTAQKRKENHCERADRVIDEGTINQGTIYSTSRSSPDTFLDFAKSEATISQMTVRYTQAEIDHYYFELELMASGAVNCIYLRQDSEMRVRVRLPSGAMGRRTCKGKR